MATAGQSKLALLSTSVLVGLAGGVIALGVFGGSGETTRPNPSAALPVLDAPRAVSDEAGPAALAAPAALTAPRMQARVEAVAPPARAKAAPRRTASRHSAAERAPLSDDDEPGSGGTSQLLAEVRLLDEARDALAAGHTAAALATLDRYGQQFPRGTLALASGSNLTRRNIGESR